ncbi:MULTISPECIES: PPK2 family polyphosphate kinase [Gulosibacter]|uniref:PPK2 family polyphosphate kinase n=1 Tax=Gulosibacter TaxID=256818 RepID=UPI000F635374|nr:MULTISPECIES: PPK2 family polyphosphate kinase [Gulosibacter]
MADITDYIYLEDALRARITDDQFSIGDLAPDETPGFTAKKNEKAIGKELLTVRDKELSDLQERMYAKARVDDPNAPSVLFVLQGMDTAGKGGIIRHVFGSVDPQGLQLASFKRPTEEELAHDFLWRIEKQVPKPGFIGVFDRSHYEDVLVQRVRSLAPAEEIERRYGAIVDFERGLVAAGTKVVKVFLHISKDEQEERLRERIEREDKHWKYNPGDIDERELWDEYQQAYEIAIQRTSTPEAPWWIVPADRKWFSRLFVKGLLLDTLRGLELDWPEADFDPKTELKRLKESSK